MAQKPPPENGYPQVRPGTTVIACGNARAVTPAKAAPPRPPVGSAEAHAEGIAALFAQVLPTLLHATARVTTDQRVFLEHLAERKGQWPALAPFIQATLTETEALFLRRVLIGMTDPPSGLTASGTESEKPTP